MRHYTFTLALIFLLFQACKTSSTDFAINWTNEIKVKIIEDANQLPTKLFYDSSANNLTLYKDGKKLKFYHFSPSFSSNGKLVSLDTALSILYSTDQNFEVVKEHCPTNERSFECIRYKGKQLGLVELKYCNGKIKMSGFRFSEDIGEWTEYDITGKVSKVIDHGNANKLEKLKDIKYYR